MANIEPNSTIRLLNNVPLDNKYTDTLYWSSISNQASNMILRTKYTFTQQTYQRVNKNRLRIQRCADDIYDCNYLMFQNTAFGNKWFYAFVVKVEYINNITSEIEYEIDDMQTWLFDYTLRPCFVEREHIADDDLYNKEDLIKPEPIDVGDIIRRTTERMTEFTYLLLVSYLPVIDPESGLPIWTGTGEVIGTRMYTGCQYATFNVTSSEGLANLQNFLTIYSMFQDKILGMVIVPAEFISGADGHPAVTIQYTKTRPTDITVDATTYTPRNNKLLYYPYTFFNIDTCEDSRNYRFEWFSTRQTPTFSIISYLCDNPEICIYPTSYNGFDNIFDNTVIDVPEKVVMRNFPTLSWRSEGFMTSIKNIGDNLIKSGVDMAIRGENDYRGKSLISHTATSVVDMLSGNNSSKLHGGGGSNVDIAINVKVPYASICGVTISRAKQIDSFFDRYGYACEEIKVPNRNVRENWTYCKTRDCNIVGSIPVDSMANIKNIYNNGITWWKVIGNVGNYSLSNRTLAQLEENE